MADNNDGVQTPEVRADTDDLNEFEALLHGKAVVKTEEVDDTDAPVDDADATENEDNQDEGDESEAEESNEAESEDESEAEEDILKPKKNRKTAQERISELTAARHEAERREQDTLHRLRELESRLNRQDAPVEPVTPVVESAAGPNPSALKPDGSLVYPLGEFDPLYIRDLTKFTVEQENKVYFAKIEQENESRRAAEAQAQLQNQWEGKLTEVEKDYSDLRETIKTLEPELKDIDPNLGTYLAQTIMGMDVGPQILYYLANHKDEVQTIIASGPVGATLALGRLEARIQGAVKKAATPARATRAPDPAPTPRGTGPRMTTKADTDDLDAFEKMFYKAR